MATKDTFSVKFWGVRGTAPTPGTSTIRYGGQTSCVEMRCGEHVLIFDAGTGLFPLGEALQTNEIDLFLSHTHIDHIMGFPFFSPAYNEDFTLRIWAGHLKEEGRHIKSALSQLMSPPLFPLTLDFLKSNISYHDFTAGEAPNCTHLKADGIEILTMPLNHPDRATAYRVNYMGKSACYVTDVEHIKDGLDEMLVAFVKDSHLLIYDSTFDDEDFEQYEGWGHSTWQEAVRIAQAGNVETLALFHHDPKRSDDALDAIAAKLKAIRPHDQVAREGLIIHLY